MKKVTLKFPVTKEGELYPLSLLKVEGNTTKAFWDAECTQPVSEDEKFVTIDVEIPEEVTKIDVGRPGIANPVDDISIEWTLNGTKVVNICKVTVILDDRQYEVPVHNEVIDEENWRNYLKDEYYLFLKPWAILVYHFEEESIGFLHWHSVLAKNLF